MGDVQNLRKHGAYMHMPSGNDPLPFLGDYPFPGAGGNPGIHMIGLTANMPNPSLGTQSGADGAVADSSTAFSAASGQFTANDTGTTITITDTGASPPALYSFTVTFVDATDLTLSSDWMGTGTTDLPWVLSGREPSNAGMFYLATDGAPAPGNPTLYKIDYHAVQGRETVPAGTLENELSLSTLYESTPLLDPTYGYYAVLSDDFYWMQISANAGTYYSGGGSVGTHPFVDCSYSNISAPVPAYKQLSGNGTPLFTMAVHDVHDGFGSYAFGAGTSFNMRPHFNGFPWAVSFDNWDSIDYDVSLLVVVAKLTAFTT
jgi:hypothetical protein